MLIQHLNMEVLEALARARDRDTFARQLERDLWPAVRAEIMTTADIEEAAEAKPGMGAIWRHRAKENPAARRPLPGPVFIAGRTHFYRRDDITRWLERTGRAPVEETDTPEDESEDE